MYRVLVVSDLAIPERQPHQHPQQPQQPQQQPQQHHLQNKNKNNKSNKTQNSLGMHNITGVQGPYLHNTMVYLPYQVAYIYIHIPSLPISQ
jgi:hypothetical protein